MAESIDTPQLVEKEIIPSLTFHDISLVKQHPSLKSQIQDAVTLGNAHHSKVSIIFRDDSGLKRVDTTLWAAGGRFVCLKGGVWLPISRILEIKI
ncbi:MAG: hypothetical protein ACON4M_04170 [Crocinitomicaceae bacterium]